MNAKMQLQCAEVLEKAEYGSPEFEVAAFAMWQAFDSGQREVLKQLLFHGPVWDGDICSKSARDTLFKLKLAVRCCFKGEQGHTAASYMAYTIFQRSAEPKLSLRQSLRAVEDLPDKMPEQNRFQP